MCGVRHTQDDFAFGFMEFPRIPRDHTNARYVMDWRTALPTAPDLTPA